MRLRARLPITPRPSHRPATLAQPLQTQRGHTAHSEVDPRSAAFTTSVGRTSSRPWPNTAARATFRLHLLEQLEIVERDEQRRCAHLAEGELGLEQVGPAGLGEGKGSGRGVPALRPEGHIVRDRRSARPLPGSSSSWLALPPQSDGRDGPRPTVTRRGERWRAAAWGDGRLTVAAAEAAVGAGRLLEATARQAEVRLVAAVLGCGKAADPSGIGRFTARIYPDLCGAIPNAGSIQTVTEESAEERALGWRGLWCVLGTHDYHYEGVLLGSRIERCRYCDKVRTGPTAMARRESSGPRINRRSRRQRSRTSLPRYW